MPCVFFNMSEMNLLLATVTLSSARKTLLTRLAILQDCGFLLPPDCRMAAKRAIFAGQEQLGTRCPEGSSA